VIKFSFIYMHSSIADTDWSCR